MKKITFVLAAMMLFLAGCSTEESGSDTDTDNPQNPTPSEPKIEIAEADKTINFTSDAGERSISFVASGNWTAQLINNRADEWCSVSPTAGEAGFSSIKISVLPNDALDERSASVQIKSGTAMVTIVVTQKHQNALTITQSRFDVGAGGGNITIEAAANFSVEYSISGAASSWIHSAHGTRAVTTSHFAFAIDPNTTSDKREGAIVVYGNGLSETVMVYQAAGSGNTDPDDPNNPGGGDGGDAPDKPKPETPSIVVSTDKVVLTSAAQSFAVEVSHNVDITYEISASWLTHADTRAMSTNTYYFDATENDDVTERTATIKFTNAATGTSETVHVTQAGGSAEPVFSDPVFLTYILDNFDRNNDGKISKEEAYLVTTINVSKSATTPDSSKIKSLQGIEYFPNLRGLFCDYNSLTSLNLSKNTQLEELSCISNNLTSLDLSQNAELTTLSCYDNPLEVLNLGDVNPAKYYYSSSEYSGYPNFSGLLGNSTRLRVVSSKITQLGVGSNKLQSLNVSECPELTYLYCSSNQLTSLDVSKNTALTSLDCSSCQLTSLDVSKNTALTSLNCSSSQLKSLDVSKNTALTSLNCSSSQLKSLDVSKNTALTELYCQSNQLKSLDVSKNTALTNLYCDSNPLELLNLGDVNITTYDGLADGKLPSATFKVISDNLTELSVINNSLRSLDVSECPALTTLRCYSNQLTSLDLSKNTKLAELSCYSNPLEVLNLGNVNPTRYFYSSSSYGSYPYFSGLLGSSTKLKVVSSKITQLDVSGNSLQSIDVTECPALTSLYCFNNPLEVLNLGNVNPTKYYYSSSKYQSYPYFYDGRLGGSTKLKVVSNKITQLDVSNNKLQSLDVSECPALTYLSCYSNPLEVLNLGNVNPTRYFYGSSSAYKSSSPYFNDGLLVNSTKLKVSSNKITQLYVSSNKLQSLDVSECPALTYLSCSSNQLTSLDVSQNTALTYLDCRSNQLTSLDVSQNTALTNLYCDSNQLTSLDVSKNTALTSWTCYSNPLEMLNLGDANLSYLKFSGSLGSSTKLRVVSSKITQLNVSNNKLQSLDVSECPALTTLDCSSNQLTSLDVSHNTALTDLSCYSNPLEVLNLGDANLSYLKFSGSLGSSTKLRVVSSKITQLNVSNNKLQSLDVSECPALTTLDCYSNQLTSLDVSHNTALTTLDCYSNQLTSLDLSHNTALTTLDCYSNQLTSLDLSHNTALTELWCHSNQLTTLDVTKTNLGNSKETYPLDCAPMSTLQTLILKREWRINGINKNCNYDYVPSWTTLVFVADENVAGKNTDYLNNSFTGAYNQSSYVSWSGTGKSGARYSGRSAGFDNSIQLRTSDGKSGIVTTVSGGIVTKIKVTWNSHTSGRTLCVYGKDTPYSSTEDLYSNNASTKGFLIATFDSSEGTKEIMIGGNYRYIGFCSKQNALYLDEIEVTWGK